MGHTVESGSKAHLGLGIIYSAIQSCFSLGFLSQNSLGKLFTFRGYKGIYSGVYEECKKSISTKQGILAA